jgi:hypothetical protein
VTLPAPETIRIESGSRWDALDLARRLPALHTYLVQLGDHRWHVCVRPREGEDAVVGEVIRTAEEWAAERSLDAVLRVGDRAFDLRH